MDEAFMGLPTFIWDNIFTIINTLVCGLIVAIFTSTFLKKKEERTRIAGVILEKRINSEQEILSYLEKELFKEEINIENSGKYDVEIIELLMEFNLPVPYGRNLQYAVVFKSMEKYGKFFYGFEEEIQKRKLWLDKAVREHLIFMQMYFANFNVIPLMVKKIPLPKGQELTDEQFANISDKLLFLLGAVCDAEINALVSKLEELIVNSVYKLDLRRPKNSILRNMMVNSDTKKIIKRMENRTILGLSYRVKKGVRPRNQRIDNIVKKFGVENRLVKAPDIYTFDSESIDYTRVTAIVEEFRKESTKFLEAAIEGC